VLGIAGKPPVDATLQAAITREVGAWAHEATSWKEHALMLLPPRIVLPAYRALVRLQVRRDEPRA
jgi:dihydrodipicolinate synthase/N-acetylneuraminate lyase